MEELKILLENPFNDYQKDDLVGFQGKCAEIAKKLFENYCINCNGKKFYFAEIEFYYWQKDKWNDKWNKVTYARDGYNAGDLFFHLSGVDICFDSTFDKNNGFKNPHFGGILIRSIIDTDNKIISGPLNCKDVFLNTCKGGEMPKLDKQSGNRNLSIEATYRSLGKTDMERNIDSGLNLCFFDINYRDEMNPDKEWFNKEKGEIEKRKGTYNTKKFNVNKN